MVPNLSLFLHPLWRTTRRRWKTTSTVTGSESNPTLRHRWRHLHQRRSLQLFPATSCNKPSPKKKKNSGLRKLRNAVKFDDYALKFKKHPGKGKLKNAVKLEIVFMFNCKGIRLIIPFPMGYPFKIILHKCVNI